jgi:hypothetical protein
MPEMDNWFPGQQRILFVNKQDMFKKKKRKEKTTNSLDDGRDRGMIH